MIGRVQMCSVNAALNHQTGGLSYCRVGLGVRWDVRGFWHWALAGGRRMPLGLGVASATGRSGSRKPRRRRRRLDCLCPPGWRPL